MEKVNTRNEHGIKNATDMYRMVSGVFYEHWTDGATKDECEAENPQMVFIKRGESVFRKII